MLVAISVTAIAGVAMMAGRGGSDALAVDDPSNLDIPGDRSVGPECHGSAFSTLTYLEPFLAGGVNPNASATAEEAAEKFMKDYLRLGRQDGAPIGELRRHDAVTFYVASTDDPDRAQLILTVEEVGGRFAVGVLWACEGASPRPDPVEEGS